MAPKFKASPTAESIAFDENLSLKEAIDLPSQGSFNVDVILTDNHFDTLIDEDGNLLTEI